MGELRPTFKGPCYVAPYETTAPYLETGSPKTGCKQRPPVCSPPTDISISHDRYVPRHMDPTWHSPRKHPIR
ncbi:Hypothetical predicted protein [Pelobates cultripes]|uniref:Uncharacterized protein n=1 Tax=Pelobates cultripes TaxID=61616 RepID=A0AAD1RFM2_PELCU|nr:Hypothetical predicted protein [Pelobates cultripes]